MPKIKLHSLQNITDENKLIIAFDVDGKPQSKDLYYISYERLYELLNALPDEEKKRLKPQELFI